MAKTQRSLILMQADVAFDVGWSVTALPALFFNAAFSSPDQTPPPSFVHAATIAIQRFTDVSKMRFLRKKDQAKYLELATQFVQCLQHLVMWQTSHNHNDF